MLMNDALIEHVHSLIARSLPARKVPTSYVQRAAHLIKPRREALNAAWRGKKKEDTGEIDRLRKEVRTSMRYSDMRERIHNWLMAIARESLTDAPDNRVDNPDAGQVRTSLEKAVMNDSLRKPNTKKACRWGINVSHAMSEKLFAMHANS